MNKLTSLAKKGLIDNCFFCFRIFVVFPITLQHFEIKENSDSGLKQCGSLHDIIPEDVVKLGTYYFMCF